MQAGSALLGTAWAAPSGIALMPRRGCNHLASGQAPAPGAISIIYGSAAVTQRETEHLLI